MRRPGIAALTAALWVTCTSASAGLFSGARAPSEASSSRVLTSGDWVVRFRPVDHGDLQALRTLYSGSSGLLWSADGRPTAQALGLLDRLRHADRQGLEPADYAADRIGSLLDPGQRGAIDSAARLARFDVNLSASVLLLLTDLHFGRVDARAAGFELNATRSALDLPMLVRELARTSDPDRVFEGVEPQFYHYHLLALALARYRELARSSSELTRLPALERRSLRPGERYSGAPALRALLAALGDLPADAPRSHVDPAAAFVLDPALVAALKGYQRQQGLDPDGVLGPAAWRELTTAFAWRVRQIELTLERWRWLPAFRTPPIIVNIPQFRLFAFRTTADRAADILQMDVIVGRTYPRNRTPVFVAALRDVIFRPYWDVPRSITMRELLGQIRARPGFTAREHYQIVRGESDAAQVLPENGQSLQELASGAARLRQLPGPDNALGLVKFVLPNAHDVYLHSTPARRLFAESQRAFSHGCIRVSDPVALATFVLRNTPGDWTAQKVTAAMNGATTLRVQLAHPIQVMILYGTVLATEAGDVLFFEDLYGQDRKLERLLKLAPVARRLPPPASPAAAGRSSSD